MEPTHFRSDAIGYVWVFALLEAMVKGVLAAPFAEVVIRHRPGTSKRSSLRPSPSVSLSPSREMSLTPSGVGLSFAHRPGGPCGSVSVVGSPGDKAARRRVSVEGLARARERG